jgi:hypothetical protein
VWAKENAGPSGLVCALTAKIGTNLPGSTLVSAMMAVNRLAGLSYPQMRDLRSAKDEFQILPMGVIRALPVAVGILAFPLLVIVAALMLVLWGPALVLVHLLAWTVWLPRTYRGVLVYSNSPNWQQDVEHSILPVVRDRLVILNWSERKRWRNSLAAWCFRLVNFGRQTGWNPMAIIFPRWRALRTVRFFDAYRDAKHGNDLELRKRKQELFELIR